MGGSGVSENRILGSTLDLWENLGTLLPLIFGLGWLEIKGAEIFPKPLHNIKTKTKNVICRRWPKIKGAELGEGGRKLEGPKNKEAEN